MPAKTETVKKARTARPAKLTARALLYDTKPAGSSPALRIACPVVGCERPPGEYCIKANEDGFPVRQTIAHKKRRELEEKTRVLDRLKPQEKR